MASELHEDMRHSRDWQLAAKALRYLRQDWWLYLLGFAFAPISAALVVARPYLLKIAIDDYITPDNLVGVKTIALWYLGAVIGSLIADTGYTIFMSYAAMRTITRIRTGVFTHTIGLASSFFDKKATGRLLTRATSDVEALGETLTAGSITIVLDVLRILAILITMFILDAKLTGLLLLLGPPIAIIIEVIRRILRRLFQEVRTSLAALNAFTAERLTGIQIVQLYNDEMRTLKAYDKRLNRYRNAAIKTNVYDALLFAIMDGLTMITMALVLWYASGDFFTSIASAGLIAAFLRYVEELYQPIREFSEKIATIQRASAALEKIFGLLDHEERIDSGPHRLTEPRGHIEFDSVAFSYTDQVDVLSEVSFSVNPGEVVAIVGRTGSGKSTIGKLLTRSYQGYRGQIRVDGLDIGSLNLHSVRNTIGTVRQDVELFPADVRFNLALGAAITDESLWEAIRLVHAEKVVTRLGGLDGEIAHKGENVSVGEAQLLAFARTMAHDPSVVILDEATASVDTLTEAAIQDATSILFQRKTVVVIAHRLSTIMSADRIVVLEGGRVVESGSHRDLLARNGPYSALFQHQFTAEQPA